MYSSTPDVGNISVTMTPDGLNKERLAHELNDEFRKAVIGVTTFVGIEVVLGFFGNLLVLYVFIFRYHVCNFRYFVLCLAFIDITSSLTTMPGEMVTQMYWYIYPYEHVCKVKSFFNVFTVSAEALCLLTIALDRYRKVCQPFGWQIKPKTAKYLCGIIYIISFVVAVPVGFLWGLHSHEQQYKGTNINVTVCEKDAKFESTKYPLAYSLTVETIIGICLLLMFALYVFVSRKLLQEKRAFSQTGRVPVAISSSTGASSSYVKEMSTSTTKPEASDNGYSSGIENQSRQRDEDSEAQMASDDEDDDYSEQKSTNTGNTLRVPEVRFGHKQNNGISVKAQHRAHQSRDRKEIARRVRRKTLIMLILTIAFIVTTILYLTLLSFIARSDDILQQISNEGKAVYFFFFRLYFINHVINPVVYGALDLKFRKVMRSLIIRK